MVGVGVGDDTKDILLKWLNLALNIFY
jgi:hypothetical protein